MIKSLKVLGAVAILAVSSFITSSANAEIAIVANGTLGDVKTISQKELKRIFLGKSKNLSGKKVKPVALSSGNAARDSFNKSILGMDAEALKAHWIKESLKGGSKPPKSLKNPGSLILYVKKKKGAIGYLDAADAAGSGLQVLSIQ